MKNGTQIRSVKTLPVAYFGEEEVDDVCLELLASIYGESEIVPVPTVCETTDEEDYLSRKYKAQVQPLFLAVEGEIIFPPIGMFDSEMFLLNYRLFYS